MGLSIFRDTSNPDCGVGILSVPSNSTKVDDRDEKFKAYRSTISSFQEYLRIDQSAMHIEHYTKTDARRWLFTEYDGEKATVAIAALALEIQLIDIYDKVNFEASKRVVRG